MSSVFFTLELKRHCLQEFFELERLLTWRHSRTYILRMRRDLL